MNAAEPEESLASAFRALVSLLEHLGMPYVVIGGLAQAVLGEPRLTQDVDCVIAMPKTGIETLVEAFQAAGFSLDRDATLRQLHLTGTFGIRRGRWRIDVIVASTDFELSAFQRAQRLRLYGIEANFPTPEDLILFKLVPGREKDLLDIKTVVIRHRERLDRAYLERWAQRLSDEAEDARMWHTLRQLLKEADATA